MHLWGTWEWEPEVRPRGSRGHIASATAGLRPLHPWHHSHMLLTLRHLLTLGMCTTLQPRYISQMLLILRLMLTLGTCITPLPPEPHTCPNQAFFHRHPHKHIRRGPFRLPGGLLAPILLHGTSTYRRWRNLRTRTTILTPSHHRELPDPIDPRPPQRHPITLVPLQSLKKRGLLPKATHPPTCFLLFPTLFRKR